MIKSLRCSRSLASFLKPDAGDPNSSESRTGRTKPGNRFQGHFQGQARQLISQAIGRAILWISRVRNHHGYPTEKHVAFTHGEKPCAGATTLELDYDKCKTVPGVRTEKYLCHHHSFRERTWTPFTSRPRWIFTFGHV